MVDRRAPLSRHRGRPRASLRPLRREGGLHRLAHEIFEWPDLLAVTDLASARKAIEIIVEQGEGARGDWIASHFGKFVGILEDLLVMRAADPSFEPARPVELAYVRLPRLQFHTSI